MFEIAENAKKRVGACIKVIGVGGGGGNVVSAMLSSGIQSVECIVANTDQQAVEANDAKNKIYLGQGLTGGLGAGADPDIGYKAAEESEGDIRSHLEGTDMLFITAGMGGGTGTGAVPVIAKIAREMGILTVAVVTKPFLFEGKRRQQNAIKGIEVLTEYVDTLIVIPNQNLLNVSNEQTPLLETFKKADSVLVQAVQSISDLINVRGLINLDFADVKTVMQSKGVALMATGTASGANRAVDAAKAAVASPLLENVSISGATGVIINITGNETLTLWEANEAASLIHSAAHEDAEIIFGSVIDKKMKDDSICITVVATGFDSQIKKDLSMPKARSAFFLNNKKGLSESFGRGANENRRTASKGLESGAASHLEGSSTSGTVSEKSFLKSDESSDESPKSILLKKIQEYGDQKETVATDQLSMNLDGGDVSPFEMTKKVAQERISSPFKKGLDWSALKKRWSNKNIDVES